MASEISTLEKIKRMNALTSIVSNPRFLEVLDEVDQGAYLLDVFAQAIDREMKKEYSTDVNLDPVHSAIEPLIQKINGFSSSPLLMVLENLYRNLAGNLGMNAPVQHVADPEANGRGAGLGTF